MGIFENILGKKQGNDNQALVNAIYRSQAVIEFDLDGRVLDANNNFLSVMGYSLDQVIGVHHRQFVTPDYAESFDYKNFWQRLASGEFVSGEFKRIDSKGQVVWLQASYNPIMDESGKPIKVIKFASDITQQKEQELTFKKTSQLSSALALCQANVMLADRDLKIVYMNNTIRQMLQHRESQLQTALPNFSVDRLIGTCVDDFHKHPGHQRQIINNLTEAYETRLNIAGLVFSLVATPWFDSDGDRIGTVVEWEDITEELKKQQQADLIAKNNARTKAALDVCQANVMMADTDLNIIYMNESLSEMLQHNESEIQKTLPKFRADKLIGACIDDFHANPQHQRGLLGKLKDVYRTRISIGSLTFNLIATPVFDDSDERIGTVVEWRDITESLRKEAEARRVNNENLRIRQALDNVSTNTMIADDNNEIVYLNSAVITMLQRAEKDIQTQLPNFRVDNLLHQNIDIFHKNPAHQQAIIERMQSTYEAEINVGGRVFNLVANPILDDDNEKIGTVVEWNDRTSEVAVEKEVNELIDKAVQGDLSSRLREDDKEGFFLNLSTGLNRLMTISDGVIQDTASMLDAMAHGNLTQRIDGNYAGTFAKLKDDANATVSKLTEIIARINQSANTVASGADEIAQGNADLSQRTEEQASSLEETASSMEEMTSTVKQNADNAVVANQLANDAQKKATEGGAVVKRAVEGMAEINDSSKKIADIIGVIDEIAFQTNLLALNAAVEAARAGEQGRGFAVVAGEVRNLAQRSAEAAKEIKNLIRDSVAKVEDGSALVNESGETLSEIVAAVERVSQMIADISVASKEQSAGIEQVNKAVTQMDEMTQQNAALVEEASAAGESMSEQARAMRQLLSFFTVESGADSRHIESISSSVNQTQFDPKPRASTAKSTLSAKPAPNALSFTDDDDWEEF